MVSYPTIGLPFSLVKIGSMIPTKNAKKKARKQPVTGFTIIRAIAISFLAGVMILGILGILLMYCRLLLK